MQKNKTQKNNKPIGVFDSGVGGLSVLLELHKILPNEDFVFLADQYYVPYGEKTKTELVKLTSKITDYFIKQHEIKAMVVACNTATCGAIDELRVKYDFPIIGTVPAIKTAALKTKTGSVAVISTPSTSKSVTLKNLIKENCKGLKVFNVGCKNLEDTVEHGDLDSSEVKNLLNKYLKDIKNSNVDNLVLGCTHYPFLKKAISKILGKKVNLVDSGRPIAKHTKNLLIENKLRNTKKKLGKTTYFTTGDKIKFGAVATKLLKHKVRSENVKL